MTRLRSCYRQLVTAIPLTLLALSCTEGTPELFLLGKLAQPKFSGQTSLRITLDSLEGTRTITGTCDARTQGLEASKDGGATYQSLASLCSSHINSCFQDETFSCVTSISGWEFRNGVSSEKTVLVRAQAEKTRSSSSTIVMSYTPTAPEIRASLFSGEVQGLGGAFKMRVRVGSRSTATEGASYRIVPLEPAR